MSSVQSIQFHPADHPTHLSKVGNWVITFLTAQNDDMTQLAITNVIPRQVQDALQARKFIIEDTQIPEIWTIKSIECFDALNNHSFDLDLNSDQALLFIKQLLSEFKRYDVDVIHTKQ